MILARESIATWKPITNKNCAGATWIPNGNSFSCSNCGSMSSEELIECLNASPVEEFSMADSGYKVYLGRYRHAGECEPKCPCDKKNGGGPIKFYSWHLFDGDTPRETAVYLWTRIRVECNRSYRELIERMKKPHDNYN